jgi:thioesterase-3
MCIDYRLPALPGDDLEIATWLSEVTPDSAVRHTTVARVSDGEVLAQARTGWGCVDLNTREAMAAPAAFLDDLMPNMALDT